jgi:hypothetical protein
MFEPINSLPPDNFKLTVNYLGIERLVLSWFGQTKIDKRVSSTTFDTPALIKIITEWNDCCISMLL